jgi:hypothetical protein
MQIQDLVHIVLDPNLGSVWPSNQLDFKLDWYKGRKWRVEYTFSSPAVPIAALSIGNQVSAVWRYEVVEQTAQADGKEVVTLRVSPERRGTDGYHIIATYEMPSLRLLTAERFEGEQKRPLELRRLPPLDQSVARAPDGRSYSRSFVMKEEPEVPPVAAQEAAEDGAEGDEDLFAGAEPIEETA